MQRSATAERTLTEVSVVLVGKVGGDSVLTWVPLPDAPFYEVVWAEDPATAAIGGGDVFTTTTPSYVDVGVAGVDYYYKIRAVNGRGSGPL